MRRGAAVLAAAILALLCVGVLKSVLTVPVASALGDTAAATRGGKPGGDTVATPHAEAPVGAPPPSRASEGTTTKTPTRQARVMPNPRAAAAVRRAVLVHGRHDDRYAPLGRLVIPAIGLDVAYVNGVHDAVLEHGPGLWPGTALPGAAGNAVLSGHRTTFTHPFGDLDLLGPGDTVRTTAGASRPVTYRVTRVFVVAERNYVDTVLRQPEGARARTLTMFACHPKGQRTHRIVVQARAEAAPRSP